jgi:hypothetical protein
LRPAHAGDGALVWMTIETEHFQIHYYEPNLDIARRVAIAAEVSHHRVTPALGHAPAVKTHIVVTDDTDGANGFASVVPRNVIRVFATAPGGFSTLNDHDDWLYGLVLHEYTHIVHLDTISGLPRWYNKVVGKTWAPNQIQPRWFIEGLATYEESKRSSSGRVRSAVFDMYLRMQVLAGRPLGLDQMSTGPLGWPQGNAAYLYGSHFLAFIADRYGDDTMGAISREFGSQPVPFGLNRAVKRVVGKDYLELYDEWTDHLARRYALQRQAVEQRGRREGRRLTFSGQTNASPRFTRDGQSIVWIRGDGNVPPAYRIVPVGKDADASRELVSIDGAGAMAMLPDGSGFVFERGLTYRTNYSFGDLFRYDFATGATTRLTHGIRAADPSVSPDGRQVAFTVNGGSQLTLAIMPLGGDAAAEIVYRGPWRFDQVFGPSWSPDGKSLVFSAWRKGGYRDLLVLDVASRQIRPLMHDRAIDGDPVWSPDGKWIYFSSDRSGIYNLYAITPDGQTLRQVTNVLGGAFSPDVSPDGSRIAYMGFDADGFELFAMDLDPATWLVPDPYVNDRPDPTELPDDDVAISAPRPYRPLESLLPDAYRIQLSSDTWGDALTISTDGSDVAGFHGYTLGATVGLERGDVSFGAAYGYGRLWPGLRVAVSRSISRPGGLRIDGVPQRYTEEVWAGSAAVSLPVLRTPRWGADLSFGYELDWFRNVDDLPVPSPDMASPRLPETGRFGGFTLRFSAADVRRALWAIGAVDGRAVTIGVRYDSPELGSETEAVEVTWRWQEFWQLPRFPRHTVSLRVAGGIEDSSRRRDGGYALGGLGTQNIAQSILDGTRGSSTALRGYAPGLIRGRQFHLVNLEYRFPLALIERGLVTLPVYVRRLHGALLADAGWAGEAFTWGEVKPSVGAVLRLDAVFGFYEGGTFELGLSRGLASQGETEWWFLLVGGL